MKPITLLLFCCLLFVACKKESKPQPNTNATTTVVTYKSFGKEIQPDDAIAAKSMAKHYQTMQIGDSIPSKIKGTINEVCQAKGCWMTIDLENNQQIMVKFKDYGFFVPKNIAGREVIINGNAYVKEVPVNELRHYAEDAGKTPEEIKQITEPERTYSFLADGVLVIEKQS